MGPYKKKILFPLSLAMILLMVTGCLMMPTRGTLQGSLADLAVKSIVEKDSDDSKGSPSTGKTSTPAKNTANLTDSERAEAALKAINEGDYDTFESLLAPVDDVRKLFPPGTLLLHRAEEAMGSGGMISPFTELLVAKKAPLLQRDSQGRWMDYLLWDFMLLDTDRGFYLDSILTGPKDQYNKAIREDSLADLKAVEEHLPMDGWVLKDALGSYKAPKVAAYALEKGAPAAFVDEETGNSLLHMLCDGRPYDKPFSDLENLARKLVAAGADVNHTSKRGDTPLYLLVRSDSQDNNDRKGSAAGLVRILLEAGSDPNAPCDYYDGTSMLYMAANNRLDDLVDLLLEFGAVVDKSMAHAHNMSDETRRKIQNL